MGGQRLTETHRNGKCRSVGSDGMSTCQLADSKPYSSGYPSKDTSKTKIWSQTPKPIGIRLSAQNHVNPKADLRTHLWQGDNELTFIYPGFDGAMLSTCRVSSLRVLDFLPRIEPGSKATSGIRPWHQGPKCANCAFSCWFSVRNDLVRVLGMNPGFGP